VVEGGGRIPLRKKKELYGSHDAYSTAYRDEGSRRESVRSNRAESSRAVEANRREEERDRDGERWREESAFLFRREREEKGLAVRVARRVQYSVQR
jgi:hypothetical protein